MMTTISILVLLAIAAWTLRTLLHAPIESEALRYAFITAQMLGMMWIGVEIASASVPSPALRDAEGAAPRQQLAPTTAPSRRPAPMGMCRG